MMTSRQCTTAGVKISIKEVNLGKNCLKECSHLLADIVHFVDPHNLQLSDNLLGDGGVQKNCSSFAES